MADTVRIPDAEATAFPWWAIVDPGRAVPARLDNVAGAITGPFFSRESADEHMRARRHAYGPKADVYCFSGHESDDWRAFCREPAPVTP